MPIETQLRLRARELGFCELRITGATLPAETGQQLRKAVADGHHAGMDWLQTTLERRVSPDAMWEDARSCLMLAMSYTPAIDVMTRLNDRSTGVISTYALGRDYHDVVKGRLKTLAGWLASRTGSDVKVFVDTAPLMEKPLGHRAGLGWQGKHTNLVSRNHGSWFFLGAILTGAQLRHDDAETDHCGTCTSCLDVCPTKAFPSPYRLDAARCISYLTIEHKGHIDLEFRQAMGNRIYGCDDCLAVCPWNKFADAASEIKLAARDDLVSPLLSDLAVLDDPAFRTLFSGSPVKRLGRDRFVRNVLIAIGNSADALLIPCARKLLDDDAVEVRAMAIWALSRLLPRDEFAQLALTRRASEADEEVRREWDA